MIELFDSLLCRNSSMNVLLMKVRGYPLCKRNIFIVKTLVWESFIHSVVNKLLQGITPKINPKEDFNRLNYLCKSILLNNKLANKNLVDFFFSFHYGIGCVYFRKIKEIIESDVLVLDKVNLLFEELKEILNITRIELEGFEFNCEIIGNSHICDNQECKNAPNVISLIVTHELLENKDIFGLVVDALKKYLNKDSGVTLVLDFRNICASKTKYKLTAHDIKIFNELNNFMNTYFYRCSCIDFGDYKGKVLSDKEFKEILRKRG